MHSCNNETYIKDVFYNLPLNSTFIIDTSEKKTYTYDEILIKANIYGEFLLSEKNIIILNNGIHLLIIYFAAILHNKIIIPIDPKKNSEEIDRIIHIHQNSSIIDEDTIINFSNNITSLKKTFHDFTNLFKGIDFDKDYLITYTSGSSGIPKGVVHSVKNLFYAALQFGKMMKYNENIRMGHSLPMTYMAGILNTIFLPFVFHGTVVLLPRFEVNNALIFWNNIIQNNINTLWLSPTMLHLLMKLDKGEKVKKYLFTVQAKISIGTAPLSPALRSQFEKKYEIKLFPSYGLSETLFISTATENSKYMASVGNLLQDVILKLDSNKELLVEVPWMFKRYTNEDTSNYFSGNLYKTGDIGCITSEELFINGRKKELIIKGGFNIYPKDIEDILLKEYQNIEICIGGVIVKNEEKIACWYSGEEISLKTMNNIILSKLDNKYKIDYLVHLKHLPKNLNGKIDKQILKNNFEATNDSKI